jgi:hypothetical protein
MTEKEIAIVRAKSRVLLEKLLAYGQMEGYSLQAVCAAMFVGCSDCVIQYPEEGSDEAASYLLEMARALQEAPEREPG